MKSVKVILASVAVFAVVGSALAFKSKDAYGSTVYIKNAVSGICSVPLQNFTATSTPQPSPFNQQIEVTTAINTACSVLYTTPLQ